MSRHMTLHEDVLETILNILKQDDYYRTLEDLPVIDDLTAYDDIRLFPELYDTSTIIERITGKADLIERQLQRLGMHPLPTNPSPSTSTSAPRPTSTFEPISPQQLTENQNTESSPQSSLPCGQQTPTGSTSTSDTPSPHTPSQPFVHSQQQPQIPTPTHHTSPKPHKPQDIQHSHVKTNVNLPTQHPISDEEQQCVPKLTNGSQVKRSKQQPRQQDECLCFYCYQLGHLKRNCPKIPYCSKCRTRGHTPDRWKLESPGINEERTKISHNFRVITTDVFIVQEIIRPQIVQQHGNGKPQPLTVLLVVQVLQHTKMHLTHHIHLHIPTHNHQPAINTVSLLYMCRHQPLILMLHNFNQTYTKLFPHHLHKITKALTITQTNNKCTHHQHNHLMHSFHNLSTPMFHHHIFHNIHLLTVHLHIVLILQSC